MVARAREIFGEQLQAEEPAYEEPSFEEPAYEEPRLRREPSGGSPVLRLIEQTRAEREAHHERVAGLFPAPEPTDWNVREIAYDRTRRARVES